MTSALKQPQLKTSLYHLYHRNFENKFLKKYQKRGKIRPIVTIYGGTFFEKCFTGKELDAETGLYYYGARYLDPRVSRWLSVDPAMGEYIPVVGQEICELTGIGGVYNSQNLHTYGYTHNNPIILVDPDGRAPVFVDVNGVWEFIGDYKFINIMTSLIDIKIPFFSFVYFGVMEIGANAISRIMKMGANGINYRIVQRHIATDALGYLSSYLGAYSLTVRDLRIARIAGNISYLISGVNFLNELFGDTSYINQIVNQRYNYNFMSHCFDETLRGFFLYQHLVRDLVNCGAITYEVNYLTDTVSYRINRELYNKYFEDIGMTSSEYNRFIRNVVKQQLSD